MRKKLPSALSFCLALCLLLGSFTSAVASHLLGGDMTYTSLGGNNYRVKFRLYRDCTGIPPSSFTLECRAGGCNAAIQISAPLVQQGAVTAGTPFCSAVSSGPCQGPAGLPNYDVTTYQADVTLPPSLWTLSTSQASRPALANIVGGDLYVEATLDNRPTAAGAAVVNNSPQFDPQDIPIQYVCWRQPTTITYSSIEADGDSVVYTLAAPLQACGTPATYLPSPYQQIVLPTFPLCIVVFPNASANFTPALPIPVAFDTVGICPIKTAQPRFHFNQQARTITLTPNAYSSNTSSASGQNKYQIAMLLTEYRRINGVRRSIGTVRREGVLIVTDCGGNTTPNPVTANNQTVNSGTQFITAADSSQINVYSCSYSRVLLNFTDPDNLRTPSLNQLLTVTLPSNINTDPNLLDSGDVGSFSLAGNGTTNPKGTFFFQPSPNTVGRVLRLNIRVEDNACPIKGVQNRVIVIRILKGNFAAAVAVGNAGTGPTPAVCVGGSLPLTGTAMRPDSVRNISTNSTRLQTYGYQWTLVSGNGFNAATATQQNITVAPTVTSRYRLRITPTSGFGPGCGDTTSVLVRVLPQVVAPTITRNGNILSSSATTGNQWYRDGQLIVGATGQTFSVTTNGTYTVTASTPTSGAGCTSAPSVALVILSSQHALPGTSLNVLPNPTPDGRFSVVLTGYHQPIQLKVFDALGRTVAQGSVPAPNPQGTTQALDLNALGAGMYLLQVRTANSLETRRVVRE
ncbi:MAG: C-terminal target protein [Hymenobacter sp.]|nr:C-terminal target protein [Hymenobacter sp.]